jgi:predicted Rossmann fold flavoprotein
MWDADAVVIGGGAAGFFGAVTLAEAAPGKRVLLLERGGNLLAKVKISGGGRCNVTHACFDPARLVKFYPRGGRELRAAFARWQPRDTVEWFAARGVALKTESDGRMFPVTDSSQTIIDALMLAARGAGVEIRVNTGVRAIVPLPGGGFELDGALRTRTLLLAAGGLRPEMEALLRGLGHEVIPAAPSIFTFNIKDPRLEGLQGLSVPEARVEAPGLKLEATGPLLITHWGLSGPGVLRLSAWGAREMRDAGYNFPIRVNWLGSNHTFDQVRDELIHAKEALSRRQVGSASPFPKIPSRLWNSLCTGVELPSDLRGMDVPVKKINRLAQEITAGEFKVVGKGQFKEEFVTAGGVSRAEIDFRTMQSRVVPGLFLAGEVVDIDGITGGFNFQAAWTTGRLAGLAMAQTLEN